MTFQPIFPLMGGGQTLSYRAGAGIRTSGLFYGEIDLSGPGNHVEAQVAASSGSPVPDFGHRLYLHGGAGNSTFTLAGDIDLMTSGGHDTIIAEGLDDRPSLANLVASNAPYLTVRSPFVFGSAPFTENLRFTGSFADVVYEPDRGELHAVTNHSHIVSRLSDANISLEGGWNTLELGTGFGQTIRHVATGNAGHAAVTIYAEDFPDGGIDLLLGGYGNSVYSASFLDISIHGGLGKDSYTIIGSANIVAGGFFNTFDLFNFGAPQRIDAGAGHAAVVVHDGNTDLTFHGSANRVDFLGAVNEVIHDQSNGLTIALHGDVGDIRVENFGTNRGFYAQAHAMIELDGVSGLHSWADVQAALTPDGHGGLALHYANGELDLVGVTKLDASFFVFG